jgi:putative phosphoribosyl transferase
METKQTIFQNRADAALKLKDMLPLAQLRAQKWHLVATSKGGLIIANYINQNINNKIDLLFSASISAPRNSECEIARVSETEEIVIDEQLVESFEIERDYIYGEAHRRYEDKILGYNYKYRKGRSFQSLQDETVLLVDEGCSSGMTLMLALKTVLAMHPKAVFIAVPIIPEGLLETLEPLADNIFYVREIQNYVATGYYYDALEDIDDAVIEKILGERD